MAKPFPPFTAAYDEADRPMTRGVYGLPNVYRVDADGNEVPLDGQRVMSGELDDSPPDMKVDAAPGNASPFKP